MLGQKKGTSAPRASRKKREEKRCRAQEKGGQSKKVKVHFDKTNLTPFRFQKGKKRSKNELV